MATRTARINALRGFCREFGIAFAQGGRRGIDQIAKVADADSALPELMRGAMALLVEEVRQLEARIASSNASSLRWPGRAPLARHCSASLVSV